MSLNIGGEIHGNQQQEFSIAEKIITIVEDIIKDEVQPIMEIGKIFERVTVNPIADNDKGAEQNSEAMDDSKYEDTSEQNKKQLDDKINIYGSKCEDNEFLNLD